MLLVSPSSPNRMINPTPPAGDRWLTSGCRAPSCDPDRCQTQLAAHPPARRPVRRLTSRADGLIGMPLLPAGILPDRARWSPQARAAFWPVTLALLAALAGMTAWWLMPATTAGVIQVLVPLGAVAAARVLDVTLGVLRTVFVVSGRQMAAGIAAFCEAAVWVAAAGFVLNDLTLAGGFAFAAGVGIGTMLGIRVVRSVGFGVATVRVFCEPERVDEIASWVRERGHAATVFYGTGRDGPRAMLLAVVRKRDAQRVADQIDRRPGTFVTIDSDPAPGYQIPSPGRV